MGYVITECTFRSHKISMVHPFLQLKMQKWEPSLSDEEKSWWLMTLKALLPVLSNDNRVRFSNYELQSWEPSFFVLWYLR